MRGRKRWKGILPWAAAGAVCVMAVSGAAQSKRTAETMQPTPALYKDVEAQINRSDYAGARKALLAILKRHPGEWRAMNLLGNLALLQDRPDEAADWYQRAVAVDPAQAEVYNNLGAVALRRGEPVRAFEWFTLAVKTDPKSVEGLVNLALLHQNNGRMKEAAELLDRALEVQPNDLEALHRRAALRRGLNDPAGAEADYRRMLEIDPAAHSARADLAFLYLEQHRLDEAEQAFRETLRAAPDLARACYGLGLTLKQKGAAAEAAPVLDRAVKLDPKNADYRVDLAFAVALAGGANAAERAEQELAAARKAAPKNMRAIFLSGVFYDDLGRPKEAIPYYEQAVAGGYRVNQARLYLAECHLKSGQRDKALALARQLKESVSVRDPLRPAVDALAARLEEK